MSEELTREQIRDMVIEHSRQVSIGGEAGKLGAALFDRWLESVKNKAYTAGKEQVQPETPAWYYAEDGEIWKLEDADTTCQYLVLSSRFFLLPLLAPGETGWAAASFANDFNWGVRLWPEADSQKETQ